MAKIIFLFIFLPYVLDFCLLDGSSPFFLPILIPVSFSELINISSISFFYHVPKGKDLYDKKEKKKKKVYPCVQTEILWCHSCFQCQNRGKNDQ